MQDGIGLLAGIIFDAWHFTERYGVCNPPQSDSANRVASATQVNLNFERGSTCSPAAVLT